MHNYRLIVSSGLSFSDAEEVLKHIGQKMVHDGICRDSYPAALLERESVYPTGVALEGHAVAIPHCDASHAIEPAIYLIRPSAPVQFQQADDDGTIGAELIIALVVKHPEQQLSLLKALFSQLQQAEFIESLLSARESELTDCFTHRLLASAA